MRALIIEDSRLARRELAHLLEAFPNIELLGEAENAEQALQLIARLSPDLIFLDIQMPGMNGFELLEKLDTAPQVIFTTAYDQYAVKAFDYNALDYLQKPIQQDRLATAIGNLNAIRDIEPWFSGGLKLTLTDSQEIEVSRRQATRFKELTSL